MRKFGTIGEILDFAIAREEQAGRFYIEMANKAKEPQMRKAFEDLAGEEEGHKVQLEEIRNVMAAEPLSRPEKLKVSEYPKENKPAAQMSYKEAIAMAVEKENASFMLYESLAEATEQKELKDLLLMLAQEEAVHKRRLETEYDRLTREKD